MLVGVGEGASVGVKVGSFGEGVEVFVGVFVVVKLAVCDGVAVPVGVTDGNARVFV